MTEQSKQTMSAEDLARTLQETNPNLIIALYNDTSVGVWNEGAQRFQLRFGRTLIGGWMHFPEGILANGKPIVPDDKWVKLSSDKRS